MTSLKSPSSSSQGSKDNSSTLEYKTSLNVNGEILPPYLIHMAHPNQTESLKKVLFQVYKNTTQRKATQRIVFGETDKVQVVGTNYGEFGSKSNPIHYAIGLINKNDQTVTVMNAPHFNLSMNIKALGEENSVKETEDDLIERRKRSTALLGESFSSKRRKKAMVAATKQKINMKALSSSQKFIDASIEERKTVMNVSGDTDSQASINEMYHSFDLIPKFDPSATLVENVYKFNEFIPEDLIADINIDFMNNYIPENSNDFFQRLHFTRFVASKFDFTSAQLNSDQVTRLKQLLVMNYLLHFNSIPIYQLNSYKKDPSLKEIIPEPIFDYFKQIFTEPQANTKRFKITTKMKLKIFCHIAVLSLMIEGYHIDVVELAKDLKLSTAKMQEIFRSVGCKIDKKRVKVQPPEDSNIELMPKPKATFSNFSHAQLCLPLSFPDLKGHS